MEERIEAEVEAVSVSSPGVGEEELVVGEERWDEMHRLKAAGIRCRGLRGRRGWIARRCAAACGKCAGRRIGGRREREALLSAHRAWLLERAAEVG